MIKIILVTFSLFSFICLSAQSDTSIDRRMIKHNQIFLINNGFICNNRMFPRVELQNKLLSNPDAFKEYKKSY